MSGRVVDSIVDLIGNTPLVRLGKVASQVRPKIYAKLEFFNPGGSVKDRIGIAMILDAERKGLIKPGFTIVEPTSGNTGMGLALAAVLRGYKIVFTVPDKMSGDKIDLLRAIGAKVRVTPSKVPHGHPANYVELAKRIVRETPKSYMPNQYENPANPQAHYASTGPEIWEQTKGRVDYLVAGVGTGGTISGVGRYLKERKPSVKIVGVDPEGSILASRFRNETTTPRSYIVEGIGEDFMPGTLDLGIVDEFVTVSDKEALMMTRRLAREDAILAGTSSGAAVAGALKVAKDLDSSMTMVVILPDTGRAYLNKVYRDDWMEDQGFIPSINARVQVKSLLKSMASRKKRALITASPDDGLAKAFGVMAKRELSNLPVVENGVLVGNLSLKPLARLVAAGKSRGKVEDAMEEPLPSVEGAGSVRLIGGPIGDRGALIVVEKGKPMDIITESDVITYLDKK